MFRRIQRRKYTWVQRRVSDGWYVNSSELPLVARMDCELAAAMAGRLAIPWHAGVPLVRSAVRNAIKTWLAITSPRGSTVVADSMDCIAAVQIGVARVESWSGTRLRHWLRGSPAFYPASGKNQGA